MIVTLIAGAALLVGAPSNPVDLDEEPMEVAERLLRGSYPDSRARGVRKLAAIGTVEAWARIREALEDRDPQVADAAQLAMGSVRDARLLASWLNRASLHDRNPWVRLRVAQIAGVVDLPVEGRLLARALDARQVDLSRALCASLEQQARAGRLVGDPRHVREALERTLGRGRDPNLRADALAALLALEGEAGQARLEQVLAQREPLLRAAALRLSTGPGVLGRAERWVDDGDPRVRLACLELIAARPCRSAVELLVLRLELEPRLHLRLRIVSALQEFSGLAYRTDARPWKRWLAGLAADWRPAPPMEDEGGEEVHTQARLGALPLPSDRLCVLLDLSGSLWFERKNGRSRKELLDHELRTLLERAPRDAAFNVIPYATLPKPWSDQLVPAEPRNVRAALHEFERCKLTGKGNVWDALLLALSDSAVDTVLIVTDGAPTGGQRWDMGLMADLIERERRWSGVAVSTVLIDAAPIIQRRWQAVAARTGGTSIAVEFAQLGE